MFRVATRMPLENPSKIQCKSCGDIIFSRYSGEWVCCSCFKNEIGNKGCYIDQTEHYCRVGGDADSYFWLGPDKKDE